MKNLTKYILSGFFSFLCVANSAQAEKITFVKEYVYSAGDLDSKISSRAIALEQTKKLLLEELGTYLVSETSVKNFEITKDQITTLTAGIVMTSIIKEHWDGNSYYLKARIVADPNEVIRAIDSLRKNMAERLELESVKNKNAAALLEIEKLRTELSKYEGASSRRNEYSAAISNLSANDLFLTGFALLKAKDYRTAISTFSKAIRLAPNNPEAWLNRGIAYEQLGLYDLALSDYHYASDRSQGGNGSTIIIEPPPRGSPRIDVMRGILYEKMGANAKKVLAEYDAAIQADSLYAEAYYRKGAYYFKLSGFKFEDQVQTEWVTLIRFSDFR